MGAATWFLRLAAATQTGRTNVTGVSLIALIAYNYLYSLLFYARVMIQCDLKVCIYSFSSVFLLTMFCVSNLHSRKNVVLNVLVKASSISINGFNLLECIISRAIN